MDYNHYESARKRVRGDAPGEFGQMHPQRDHRQPRDYAPSPDSLASQSFNPVPPRKGRGKGSNIPGDMSGPLSTEYRIPVDVYAFPPDVNVITQLLGPRGRHQTRMRMESDTIVTTTGKGVRGPLMQGEEPLSLVLRSKDPTVPLTQRQVSVVFQVYEDILKHVKEFGNSDNAGDFAIDTRHIMPMSLMEMLWNLHILLSRPRVTDLRVDEVYQAYYEYFSQECPLASWLVVDPSSGGLQGAISRIPHIVELYQVTPGSGPWFARAANSPDFNFTQIREVDDAYKIRLQQIAAGMIPIEDLADSSGITGMLFGLDRVSACANILIGIIKLLKEKSSSTNPMDLNTLKAEFYDLYKIELDVFSLISERSLLQFMLKFRNFFNTFNDGISWKVMLTDEYEMEESQLENLVKSVVLVQPSPRRVVRLSKSIPLPVAHNGEVSEAEDENGEEEEGEGADTDTSKSEAFNQLMNAIAAAKAATVSAQTAAAQTVEFSKKKDTQKHDTGPKPPTSGNALDELMATLKSLNQN